MQKDGKVIAPPEAIRPKGLPLSVWRPDGQLTPLRINRAASAEVSDGRTDADGVGASVRDKDTLVRSLFLSSLFSLHHYPTSVCLFPIGSATHKRRVGVRPSTAMTLWNEEGWKDGREEGVMEYRLILLLLLVLYRQSTAFSRRRRPFSGTRERGKERDDVQCALQ